MKSRYACPDCGGRGEVICSECNRPHECEECRGVGLDPERIDIVAYRAATDNILWRCGVTSAWIEDDEVIGRKSACGSVRIEDFLLKKE